MIISLFQALVIFVTSTVLSLCHSSPAPLSSSPPLLTETATHHLAPATTKPRASNQGHALTYTFVFGPPCSPTAPPKTPPTGVPLAISNSKISMIAPRRRQGTKIRRTHDCTNFDRLMKLLFQLEEIITSPSLLTCLPLSIRRALGSA